jgi:hypothetical protein
LQLPLILKKKNWWEPEIMQNQNFNWTEAMAKNREEAAAGLIETLNFISKTFGNL